jgi:hypothetical protein
MLQESGRAIFIYDLSQELEIKLMVMKRLILIAILLIVVLHVNAQYTSRTKNPYHQAYHDSLKKMDYPYMFPILGKKAYKKGFDLPFPWGISPLYFAARQEIEISRTAVSINNSELIDLTEFIEFGKIINETNAFTLRPDLWVVPFLNVYGIFGVGNGSTEVPIVAPVNFSTTQKSKITSAGFGITLAGSMGGVLLILDNNFNWADVDRLEASVPAFNSSARIGHNFVDQRRADRSVAVWGGFFYQKIKAETIGNLKIKDVFPGLTPDEKDEIKARLDEWLTSLPPGQEAVARQIVEQIGDYFAGTDAGDGTIHYELDKKISGPWNMIFGAQYQHNKNWMLRMELGTFGKRSQFLLNLNYRFQSFKRKS